MTECLLLSYLGHFEFIFLNTYYNLCNNYTEYRMYRMYLDRQVLENSVDPDETPQNVASHQGPRCLPLIQQF